MQIKPRIVKLRDVRGRRSVGYSAELSGVTANGPTAKDATTALEVLIVQNLERLTEGPIFGTWNGHAYAVVPAVDGWLYWIDTFSASYQGSIQRSTRAETVLSAIHHLAQNTWTADTDDPSFLTMIPIAIRSDLAGWIGFQRAYIRELAADPNISPAIAHHTEV